jgi:flagellar biosynthetic protein FliR
MEIVELLKDENVIKFFLLFIRFSVLFAFFPFFSHQSISVSIKGAMALYFTLLFYPILPDYTFEQMSPVALILAGLAEVMFGILASIALMITFYVLLFAGEQIATVMGLTMANIMDPNTQTQTTVVGQILNMLALLLFLFFDGHHMLILFIHESLSQVPLGSFVFEGGMLRYYTEAMINFYVIGFSIAFPIIAIGILADAIFGMIMKTMPQFNLLVIGLPIKIALAFIVLGAVLGGMLMVWKTEYLKAFEALQMFFK